MDRPIPDYVKHAGTVTLSGRSAVGKVARYATLLFENDTRPIDFIFIGANAGQQCYKACSIVANVLEEKSGTLVAFYPVRVRTDTLKRDICKNTVVDAEGHDAHETKDAYIWRMVDATSIRKETQ